MGAADGTIMAIIITVHIANRSRRVTAPHGSSGITMPGMSRMSMSGMAAFKCSR